MFKKIITINNEKELKSFYRKLFFYKTYFFFFTKFSLPKDTPDTYNITPLLKGLNIKNRRHRLSYIIDTACSELDAYYTPKNLCRFKHNKCLVQRQKKQPFCNGCCRLCRYQSKNGCLTKNVACKFFYCTKALKKTQPLKPRDIKILSLLNCVEKYIITNDYFSSKNEVLYDLYFGFVVAIVRIPYRHLKYFLKLKFTTSSHTSTSP